MRGYVQDRLAGVIARLDGELVPDPEVRFADGGSESPDRRDGYVESC